MLHIVQYISYNRKLEKEREHERWESFIEIKIQKEEEHNNQDITVQLFVFFGWSKWSQTELIACLLKNGSDQL